MPGGKPRKPVGLGVDAVGADLDVAVGEELLELLGRHRLLLHEHLGKLVEHLPVLNQQVLGLGVGLVDEARNLGVDKDAGLRRHGGLLGAHLAAEEGGALILGEGNLADLLRHAEAGNHHLGGAGDALDVVGSSSGDLLLSEDDLLRDAAAEGDSHLALEELAGVEARVGTVLIGSEEGEATGAAAGRDGDLGNLVVVGDEGTNDGVASLVVGNELALLERRDGVLLLGAEHDAVEGVADLIVADGALVLAGGEDGSLVHQVGEGSAREAWGTAGDLLSVDVVAEGLAARVNAEDGNTAVEVGEVDDDAAIETAGTEEGGVEDVGAVSSGDGDDARVALEAVHLGEDLVEGLLALVVATSDAGTTLAADSVDLIDEDDAGGVLLGLGEEVANTRGTNTDEHLDKLRARDGEEGHTGLASDGAGEEGLAGSGGSLEDEAAGDTGAELSEAVRLLEELDNLLELDLGTVDADNVIEGHTSVGLHLHLGARAREVHGATHATHATHAAALAVLGAAREEEEAAEEDGGEDEGADKVAGLGLLLGGEHSDVDLVDSEHVEELRVLGEGIELEAVAVDVDGKELAAVGREGDLRTGQQRRHQPSAIR